MMEGCGSSTQEVKKMNSEQGKISDITLVNSYSLPEVCSAHAHRDSHQPHHIEVAEKRFRSGGVAH